LKKAFRIGLIGGFIAGVIVAIAMDMAFKDALGGSWADAVSHDLSIILKRPVPSSSFIVLLGVIFLVGIVGLFGALVGGVVALFLYKLFSLLKN